MISCIVVTDVVLYSYHFLLYTAIPYNIFKIRFVLMGFFFANLMNLSVNLLILGSKPYIYIPIDHYRCIMKESSEVRNSTLNTHFILKKQKGLTKTSSIKLWTDKHEVVIVLYIIPMNTLFYPSKHRCL